MSDIASSEVTFPGRDVSIRAFLASPSDGRQARPAVIIIQEWWGLNDHMKDIARRFAECGYVSLAPDLYSRLGSKVTADAAEAARLMEALSSQAALLDLNAATTFLKKQDRVDPQRLGVVGFCLGGTFALTMACHNSDLKAAVPFYGKVPPIESLRYLLCPVLYHYGAKDGWVTSQEVQRLKQGLEQFGKPGEVVVYPEAEHAFFNDTRPEVYRQGDAQRAWDRTLAFFAQHLR